MSKRERVTTYLRRMSRRMESMADILDQSTDATIAKLYPMFMDYGQAQTEMAEAMIHQMGQTEMAEVMIPEMFEGGADADDNADLRVGK